MASRPPSGLAGPKAAARPDAVAAVSRRPVVARDARDAAPWGTILGVWAHPDDEAYLSAGLMALAVEAGNRVVCVTATRGERGTDDPGRWPPERLARRRSEELAASLAALGVAEHRWLDHADGSCAAVSPAAAAAQVADLIDEVRPDTVVTFGPDGFTGHRDHVAVSHWVDAACGRARWTPARVWWAVAAESWVARFRSLNERVPVFGVGAPVAVADADLAVVVAPRRDIVDRKVVALRAQRTQTRGLIEAVGEATYRSWWAQEHFAAAATVIRDLDRGC